MELRIYDSIVRHHALDQFATADGEMNDKPHTIDFNQIGDKSKGFISVAENPNIPFTVERVHWTYLTPKNITRGNHGHKTLRQVIIPVVGSIDVVTETLNGSKQTFILHQPNVGLYIPALCWTILRFSSNAVLLCLASQVYDEGDYIRDYEDFLKCRQSS